MASIKDALAPEIRAGEPADLVGDLRRPALVPEGVRATEALAAFERSGLPLALVIDERGNIEGLVTPSVVRRGDGSWLVDGLTDAAELKEGLGLRGLPDEREGDYQSVGGMVMACLGRVPMTGDRFGWEGFSFEVVDTDGHRVDKVLVTRDGGMIADDASQG